MTTTLNVGSNGMGSWGYDMIDPLLHHTFPHTQITHDPSRPSDLVVLSHFTGHENIPFNCPYIIWSGEAYRVRNIPSFAPPLIEINTAHHAGVNNSLYFPQLVTEISKTARPSPNKEKKWCAAYAFGHSVLQREQLFRGLRARERTCYSFGRCSPTPDSPFILTRDDRTQNGAAFGDFGFIIAMENSIVPGYVTEKIGHAFNAGSVPIYWGDRAGIEELCNPAAFINVLDYPTIDKAAETIIGIWRDKQKLQKYLDVAEVGTPTLRDYEAVYTEYRPWMAPFVNRLREAFPDLH